MNNEPKFTVKPFEGDQPFYRYGIFDASGVLVDNHPYSTQEWAQSECALLNAEAIWNVGDRVRPILGFHEGEAGTITVEKISLYPSPYVQYIVTFETQQWRVYHADALEKAEETIP